MKKSINKRLIERNLVNVMTADEVYALTCIVRKFYGRYFAFPCNQLVLYNFNEVKDETVIINKEEIDNEGRMNFTDFADTIYTLRRKHVYPYDKDGTYNKNLIVGFFNYVEGDMDNSWIRIQISRKITVAYEI